MTGSPADRQQQHGSRGDLAVVVDVVIPAFNAEKTIGEQLAALSLQQEPPRFRVWVVDNASTDATASVVCDFATSAPFECTVVPAVDKQGPGYARNVGARCGSGDVLLFCDSDDVVALDWVRLLAGDTERSGAAAGRMKKFTQVEGSREIREVVSARQLWLGKEQLPWPVSACLGVRRDVLEAVGGFDDTIPSGEDIDLGMKLLRAKVALAQSEATILYRLRDGAGAERRQLVTYAEWDSIMQRRHADLLAATGARPDGVASTLRALLGHVRRRRRVVAEHGAVAWRTWYLMRRARLRGQLKARLNPRLLAR